MNGDNQQRARDRAHRPRHHDDAEPAPAQENNNRDRSRSPAPVLIPDPPVAQAVRAEQHSAQRESGFLSSLVAAIPPMMPVAPVAFILVDTVNYERYFSAMYRVLANNLYPSVQQQPANIIAQDRFVLICRFLLKGRCDSVYTRRTAIRQNNRCLLPSAMPIPKCIADIISNVGMLDINAGTQPICPMPEPPNNVDNLNLNNLIAPADVANFNRFVTECKNILKINVVSIPMAPEGRPYWLLHASHLPDAPNEDSDFVTVSAAFSDFTPADALLAAMVQNRATGIIPGSPTLTWSTDRIRGLMLLRSIYAIQA